MGFGLSSSWNEQLLVRVGEDAVIETLATKPHGVRRCVGGGRTFSGTLMVEPDQFGGNKLQHWFDLAVAHNRTMKAKLSSEKRPQKKP